MTYQQECIQARKTINQTRTRKWRAIIDILLTTAVVGLLIYVARC